MNILVILIPVSLSLGGLGLLAFLWSIRTQQYDDPVGNAARILLDPQDETSGPSQG
ncbi:MAG: cbb3-type cytochrome oxidase assembly protein CcoS [Pseudomonadota bacterium]